MWYTSCSQDWSNWEGWQERYKHQPLGEEGLEEGGRVGQCYFCTFQTLGKFSVQVTIMEEAGQDVPSWLRGEADRFLKHEVQGIVFLSSYVTFATQALYDLLIGICMKQPSQYFHCHSGSPERGRPWRRFKRRWKVRWQWMLQMWAGGEKFIFYLIELILSGWSLQFVAYF